MKRYKLYSIILVAAFSFQMFLPLSTFAAGQDHQTPPTNLDSPVSGITYDTATGKYYTRLNWTPSTVGPLNVPDDSASSVMPGTITDMGYYIFTKNTKDPAGAFRQYPLNLSYNDPASGNPRTTFQLDKNGSEDLKSGTIYAAKMQAYHTHTYTSPTNTNTLTTHTSVDSNTTYFMTDIALEVKPAGTNSLDIIWDDVWYGSNRISYEVHISESKDFVKDTTLTVTSANIAAAGPVVPSSGGKLTYRVTGSFLKDSTLYYVKIKPIISDIKVKHNVESSTVVGYTNIIASMTKISDGWWKVIWNPVTDSSLQSGSKVTYTIKRGLVSAGSGAVMENVAQTTDTKYYLNITDNSYFYMIVADIKDGYGNRILDQYGYGIKSDKLYGIDAGIPTTPTVPDLKTVLYLNPSDTASTLLYNDSISPWLQSKEATIAWTPPTLADGITTDTDIAYDIYLVTDPGKIDDTTVKPYAADVKTFSNITDGSSKILAYTYKFPNLTPNTLYYLKLIAKKTYTVDVNGVLQAQDFLSAPALKVIITPPNGSIDQPIAPEKPPVKIKHVVDDQGADIPDANGNPTLDVGTNNAWVEWANKWGETWDGTAWNPVDLSVQDATYDKVVGYDTNTTYNIGYVEYSDTLDIQTLQNLPMQVQGIPNTTTGSAYRLLYNVTGLKPNTTYVIWIKAYNPNIGLLSEASDPVVVVTKPDIVEPVEKPIVPTFIYNKAWDTSVDLQWDYRTGYTYYIKYATSDNINSAQNTVTVKPADLLNSQTYTVKGLSQNTIYYFWIQADSTGKKIADGLSLWNDGYPVKTLPYTPPETPKGFGVKNTSTAVGKNNITYEWIQQTGLQYTLEIASDINYKDAKKYSAGAVSEYNVTGLLSNHRYYARLYAVDPAKGNLSSLPTESITTRTLRSDDDYDADQDIDNVITGPFIINEGTIDGVETKSITGSNADRFIEKVQTDKVLDYAVDFTDDSTSNNKLLKISYKVLSSLSNIKENLILDVGFCKFTIRPNMLSPDQEKQLNSKLGDYNLEIGIKTEDLTSSSDAEMNKKGLTYRTESAAISINAVNGANSIPVNQFNKPLKVSFKYTALDFYVEGKTIGYYYDDVTKDWVEKPTTAKYNKTLETGYISYDLNYPKKAAVLVKGNSSVMYEDISGVERYTQIAAIAFKYNLKSVESTKFRPNDNATIGEAVKLVMDILGSNYDEDYGSSALKARFINPSDSSNLDGNCSRKKALQMVDRLYEIKTGSKPEARQFTQDDDQPITRGDFAGELYIMLNKLGEV